MGSGIMDHFPENRCNKHLGRPFNEREYGTLKGLKTGHWAWNSESQDVETWGIVPIREQSLVKTQVGSTKQMVSCRSSVWGQ